MLPRSCWYPGLELHLGRIDSSNDGIQGCLNRSRSRTEAHACFEGDPFYDDAVDCCPSGPGFLGSFIEDAPSEHLDPPRPFDIEFQPCRHAWSLLGALGRLTLSNGGDLADLAVSQEPH